MMTREQLLAYIFQRYIPDSFKNGLMKVFRPQWYKLRIEIINYLEDELKLIPDREKEEALIFLKNNHLSVAQCKLSKSCLMKNIIIYTDKENGMKYGMYENKRLYFPREYNTIQIKNLIFNMILEQDVMSPHRYEFGDIFVNEGDIVADIGCCDGNFSLGIVEKAKKIYLFECEKIWNEPLLMTFKPWKDKIVLVNKYVSDIINENSITLDNYFKKEKVDFIKADVEGSELKVLMGAMEILAQNMVKVAITTYHKEDDAIELKQFLEKNGFTTQYSTGYMIMFMQKLNPPYLRRGVIRGKKQ
jgi:hypothetical protein